MMSNPPARRPHQPNESGAAMLIAIFALLLISVVAIALVVSSGTDSSLAGNYRTASSAYYAGVAGLEEARGRLLWKNPDCIVNRPIAPNCPNAGFIPMAGVLPAMTLTQVRYILNPNPLSGESVDPTNTANPYADTEYQNEFGFSLSSADVQTTGSVSDASGIPGPAYKWARITPATEQSIGVDVNGDGNLDHVTPLVYDPAPAYQPGCPPANPGLFLPGSVPNCPTWSSNTAVQVLEITVLAVAPNGGKRLLQYIVAPIIISPDTNDVNFPAAIMVDDGQAGNALTFNPPSGLQVSGVDQCTNPIPAPPPGTPNAVAAVGYSSSVDYGTVLGPVSAILSQNPSVPNYQGTPISSPTSTPPSKPYSPSLWLFPQPYPPTSLSTTPPPPPPVGYPLRQSWLQPASLDAVMQDIVNSADVIINGPATGSDIWNAAPGMATTPMTIVVKGDLTLNGGFGAPTVGNGLLLVTGTLTYHPSATWNGIILVVGQGQMLFAGHHGTGGIYGTVFVAQTRDSSGNLLPSLQATFGPSSGSDPGNGILYSSCSVNLAQGPITYKVLSFHEIPLPN